MNFRLSRVTDAWAEQKIVREIMVFLHSHGVGTARAVRIFKTYGSDAIQVMTENPYRPALRHQHIDLTQLRNNLFRCMPLPCH
jgi:hypothetical protein